MLDQDSELNQITVLLRRLSAGDSAAEAPLADAVYDQMRVAARGIVGRGAGDITMQATGLVNVVLLELVRLRSIDWKDRDHFYRTASRMLRRRFIDYIRSRNASKRPPSGARDEFEDCLLPMEERFDEILDVHRGLEKLAELDPELAELVEMVYFGGCPVPTIAEMRGVSPKTIRRHLELAGRLLKKQFSCPPVLAIAATANEE
jgi:RNA polymerase sigma-70 factor (ECF subfamily)